MKEKRLKNWDVLQFKEDFDTGYGGPSLRFHIRRLKSGRILLINHYDFDKRNNLTAMLSEDDGKTYTVEYYNLDVIISVGYRVKSQRGVEFRKWANKVLNKCCYELYAIN